MASKQAITLFGFFSDPSKSGVLNPNSVFIQTMISCFKAIPSFFSKKRSPQMNSFGFCVSH